MHAWGDDDVPAIGLDSEPGGDGTIAKASTGRSAQKVVQPVASRDLARRQWERPVLAFEPRKCLVSVVARIDVECEQSAAAREREIQCRAVPDHERIVSGSRVPE